MATLSVPERHRPAVAELTSLGEEKLRALDDRLSESQADESRARSALRSATTQGDLAFDALLAMTAMRLAHDLAADEVSQMVRETLGADAGNTDIARLLENGTIVRLAKRLDLDTAFERGLHTFRVLTDIRPVFDEDPSIAIDTALITHTVQITYAQDNQYKELYFAVDEDDLQTMLSQVQRALTKSATVEEFIKRAGATVLRNFREPS